MAKTPLTDAQKDKLLTWFFFGFDEGVILKRFEEEEGIRLGDTKMFTYWKHRAEKNKNDEALKAAGRYRERMFEKSYSGRMARLDTLYSLIDKGLKLEIDPTDSPLRFKQMATTVMAGLKQAAQELDEWKTGDTINIVYNIINPVFEELAFVLVRHLPEGEPRMAALEDLRRVSQQYMKSLPEGKTIKAKAKRK